MCVRIIDLIFIKGAIFPRFMLFKSSYYFGFIFVSLLWTASETTFLVNSRDGISHKEVSSIVFDNL